MPRFLNDIFTGSDNTTYEVAHLLWVLAVLCYLVYTGYVVWFTKVFDGINFGTGFLALMTGGGIGSVARAGCDKMDKIWPSSSNGSSGT
jgi:uncharacterized membrane protein AbrB (regulator of aidB expression)